MDYIVLDAPSPDCLSDLVKTYLLEGWELQGGVSVSLNESDDYCYQTYAQAMIKKEAVCETQ